MENDYKAYEEWCKKKFGHNPATEAGRKWFVGKYGPYNAYYTRKVQDLRADGYEVYMAKIVAWDAVENDLLTRFAETTGASRS
jgi:hypothetical protein